MRWPTEFSARGLSWNDPIGFRKNSATDALVISVHRPSYRVLGSIILSPSFGDVRRFALAHICFASIVKLGNGGIAQAVLPSACDQCTKAMWTSHV